MAANTEINMVGKHAINMVNTAINMINTAINMQI
jgi:hypothetical protein